MRVVLVMLVMTTAGLCNGLKTGFKSGKIIELQSEKAVKSFIQSNTVRAVYFYIQELKNLKYFFQDFDDAAEALENYEVTFGYCNCTEEANKDVHLCKIQGAENGIHAFRSGKEIMFFQLAKLFNANSMAANILQLVMLKDVPLLRNEKEVGSFIGNLGGKKDLVFAYLTAVGSIEHLGFLEIAHDYKKRLQFAITTDWKATKQFGKLDRTIKDTSTVWWVWSKDNSFTSVRHRGEFNNCHLARFIEILLKPKIHDIPGDGLDNPFSSFDVPVVKFYYNAASKDQVHQEANILLRYHGGSLWILLINMDDEAAKEVYKYEGMLPALSGQKTAKDKEVFIGSELSTPNILRFISDSLGLEHNRNLDSDSQDEQSDVEEQPPFDIEEVSRQDDGVAEAVTKSKHIEMPLDFVPALTDKIFQKSVEESKTTVILFFFPYDAVSMANLRMFGEAADLMGEQTTLKIARVDCYDWTDVCQKEQIIIYPTLRVYKNGKHAWDYKGPQDTGAMFSTLKLLEMSLPVYEADREKVVQYLVGSGETSLTGITNTTVVGLFGQGDKQEKEVFQQLAESSRDRIMYVYTDTSDAGNIAKEFSTKLPAVILSRYNDPVQPHVPYDGTYTLQNLQDFVDSNKLPKLTVLTPLMFAEVRQKFNELLILFTDGSDSCRQSEDTVKDVVKAQKFNNISFNMIQVPDDTSMGYKVLQEYTTQPDLPHLSLVKFQKGEVFNFDAGDMDMLSVTDWLSHVVKGSVDPSAKLKENDWKPMNKGYEFLKIMEWEKRNSAQENVFTQRRSRSDVPDTKLNGEDDDGEKKENSDSRLHPQHLVPGRAPHHSNRGDNSKKEENTSDKPVEKETEKKDADHEHSEL